MQKFAIILFAVAALSIPTFAYMNDSDVLMHKYDVLACKMDAVGMLANYSGGNETGIISHLQALRGYAASGDMRGFLNYANYALREDVRGAFKSIKEVRKGVKGRMRGMGEVRKEWADARSACLHNVSMEFAKKQLNESDEMVSNMNATMHRLANKGVDTNGMSFAYGKAMEGRGVIGNISANAGSEDLDGELSSARDAELHAWVQFHAEKILAISDAIENDTAKAGRGGELDAVRNLARGAEAIARNTTYANGEFDNAKSMLKDATSDLKTLMAEVYRA
jgi:hypothetical protein